MCDNLIIEGTYRAFTCSRKEHIMTILKETTAAAITNAVSTTLKGDRAKVNAVDALWADGVRYTDMITMKKPESTATPELWDSITKAIVAGFPQRSQDAFNAPSAKGMTDAQKLTRRATIQNVGGKRSDFKAALMKREEVIGGGAKPKRSDAQRIADNLNDCSKVIENSEGIDGVDLLELGKAIKAAKSALHAKF